MATSGVVARAVARVPRSPRRIVGVDVNEGMLAVAAGLPSEPPVDWLHGDAASLPLEDGSVDLILCLQGR